MSMWQDYLARIEKDLEQLRSDLEHFESGKTTFSEQVGSGKWRDVTQDRIDQTKRIIDTYERIANAIQRRVPF